MWIHRDLESELIDLAATFPALVVVGPRQVGKTSLLEHTFPEVRYVSLDVGLHAEMAETRPDDLLAQYPPPVIFDEVQYAPALFRHLKTVIDSRRGETGLFLLSGSQNFMLMESVSESLAGRAAVVPLLGLSASEWKEPYKPTTTADWIEFLWRGSFPGLWSSDPRVSRDRWYQGYLATYLERDVRNLVQVGNLRDFERFLRAAAIRCSQTLNLSELARDVGISPTTARQWMSVLQASNLVFLLEPYHRSLGKRLVKSPKLYFSDTGLVAYLMGFSSAENLAASHQAGALWECHVVSQWLRWRDWHQPAAGLWYWRDQPGNEVDLVVELDQLLFPIECKIAARPQPRALKGIRAFRTMYGETAIPQAFIACTTTEPYDLEPHTTAMNGWTTWPLGK